MKLTGEIDGRHDGSKHFSGKAVVPVDVTYAPTRTGKPRWAVLGYPVDHEPHGSPLAIIRPWHVWDRDLATHFAQRVGYVVTCGGTVRMKGSDAWVSITSVRMMEPLQSPQEWAEARELDAAMEVEA